jgi:predicted ATP-dependent endonuclease of OLD family
MKISNIYIKNFEQFQDVELDFTNPDTGLPVEKVCLIGRNGTGKSKILRMLNWVFHSVLPSLKDSQRLPNLGTNPDARVIFKMLHRNKPILIIYFKLQVDIAKIETLDKNEELTLINDLLELSTTEEIKQRIKDFDLIESSRHIDFLKELIPGYSSTDLVIYSPDESKSNGYLNIKDVPETNVNDAQTLFQNLPVFVEVSSDTVNDFWKLLVFNMRKREEERTEYETLPENINKTKANLIKEFDQLAPKILEHLANIWNEILDSAGLEFDVKGANNPYQLKDNLKAYIKLKKSSQIIKYNELSTGIRNFIFRIGHIYSLYFNRQIDRGFLLIDEPENGLFPDFLFDLMKIYQKIVLDKTGNNNTQMFFATHNPIIAAQFKPFERIILDWNDDATVKVYRGVAPEGDDPNDVLKKDFGLHELMGPAGIQQWAKYLSLKRQLKKAESSEDKMNLAAAINKIGQSYNFPA